MKKVILILIVCTIFLMGCENGVVKNNAVSENQTISKNVVINYEGTSRNWTVSYKIDGNVKLHDCYYTFKYTSEDADSVKDVNYSIDGNREGESGKFTFRNTKEYTGKMKMTGGLPNSTDRGINVKMKWNGDIEAVVLKRTK